jgi:hypothetical protein
VSDGGWLEAEEAVAEGSLLRAIDVLTEANRRAPDALREQRLVQLRHDAVSHLLSQSRPEWPRVFADPYDGTGLPEIDRDDMSVERVGGGLLHHGAVLVRGLIDSSGVERLVNSIDRALDAAHAKRSGTMSADDVAWFSPFGRREKVLGQGTEWVRVVDSPRATFEVTEVMDAVNRAFITGYLGERPVMASYKWTLRRITPACIGEWHQDGRFLGDDVRVANVWIALTRCGGATNAPGLEVLPRRMDHYLAAGSDGARLKFAIGDAVLDQHGSGLVADPVYEPGDALIFDERTPHRTGSRPGLTSSRHAIEAWFFAPGAYPDGDVAFVF